MPHKDIENIDSKKVNIIIKQNITKRSKRRLFCKYTQNQWTEINIVNEVKMLFRYFDIIIYLYFYNKETTLPENDTFLKNS